MSERPIIVGWDGSPGADEAVRWAARTAARHDRALRIVQVVRNRPDPGVSGFGTARALAAEVAPALRVDTEIIHGQPVEILRSLSEQAEVVVVGTRGHSRFRATLVGSVGEAVTQQAHSPVVVVRGKTVQHPSAPVVVGIDGSSTSAAAIAYAVSYARMLGAPLLGVTAVPDPLQSVAPEVALTEEHAALVRRDAERTLHRALTDVRAKHPDLAVEPRILELEPPEALIRAAEEAQILVVGSHGRRGFAGMVLGSVSRTLLHQAPCPVAVIVRPRRRLSAKAVRSGG